MKMMQREFEKLECEKIFTQAIKQAYTITYMYESTVMTREKYTCT